MLPFGHLGIGSKLVSPWTRELPKWALLLGTVLPDLIDKPLYYGLAWAHPASTTGLISCTRSVGHTALLLLAITGIAVWRRSRWLAALSFGIATHLLLDNIFDVVSGYFRPEDLAFSHERSSLVALLFPFYLPRFSPYPFTGLGQHAQHSLHPLTLGAEVVGAAILGWDAWKNQHETEILQLFQVRRHLRKLRRRRSAS